MCVDRDNKMGVKPKKIYLFAAKNGVYLIPNKEYRPLENSETAECREGETTNLLGKDSRAREIITM